MTTNKKQIKNKIYSNFNILTLVAGLIIGFIVGVAYTIHTGLPKIELLYSSNVKAQTENINQEIPKEMNQLSLALQSLEEKIKANPNELQPLKDMGDLLMGVSKYDQAKDYYEKALKISGEDTNLLIDLGFCLRETGQPQKALEAFQKAIKIEPKAKNAYYNAGVVALYDLNQKDLALNYLQDYLKLDPPLEQLKIIENTVEQLKKDLKN